MEHSAQGIINSVERKYPRTPANQIRNSSDIRIESKIKPFHQFIFGLTPPDQFTNGVDNYVQSIKNRVISVSQRFLNQIQVEIDDFAWPFDYPYHINHLKSILQELAEFYEADLDSEAMFQKLNGDLKSRNTDSFYLVIIVVSTPILQFE